MKIGPHESPHIDGWGYERMICDLLHSGASLPRNFAELVAGRKGCVSTLLASYCCKLHSNTIAERLRDCMAFFCDVL